MVQIQMFYDDFEVANPLSSKQCIHELGAIYFIYKVLEKDGIEIPLYGGCVHGSVVQVTADNLGLHSLFGLVKSFSTRYCCRFCLAEKDDFQTEFSEDSSKIVLRTKDTPTAHCHEMACNQSLTYVFGIKN